MIGFTFVRLPLQWCSISWTATTRAAAFGATAPVASTATRPVTRSDFIVAWLRSAHRTQYDFCLMIETQRMAALAYIVLIFYVLLGPILFFFFLVYSQYRGRGERVHVLCLCSLASPR